MIWSENKEEKYFQKTKIHDILLEKNEYVSLDPIESSFFESYRNYRPNYLEMHQNILK